MAATRVMQTSTVEHLEIAVTANVTLDLQPVAVSFDQATWMPAQWVGDPGLTRTCRVLLGDSNALPRRGLHTVYVQVVDNPEAPVIEAGSLEVR